MKIITPITMTDAKLVSTNIPEVPPAVYAAGTTYNTGDYVLVSSTRKIYASLVDSNIGNDPETSPTFWVFVCDSCPDEYVAGTTYAEGDRVIVVATHKVYESLVGSNIGNYPPDTLNTSWLEIGATHPWRAFDSCIGACKVSAYGTIEYEITPGEIAGGVAILNLEGAISVSITVTSAIEGVVYTNTLPLVSGEVYDWYSYFFSDFILLESAIFTDLPAYRDGTISIVIESDPSSVASVGEIVIGPVLELGFTQYAPSVSIIDYSKKELDTFGNFTILERAFSKRISTRVIIENNKINRIIKTLASIRATPVVWVATENDLYESSLTIYGYYRDFSTVIPHPVWAEMNLEIEGLI